MSDYSFLPADAFFRAPREFNFDEYIEIEKELWMIFPETEGHRVNFIQFGISALLMIDVADDGSEITTTEAYFVMPCENGDLKPIRMRAIRHLTLDEYRMAAHSSLKLVDILEPLRPVMKNIGRAVTGDEISEELDNVREE